MFNYDNIGEKIKSWAKWIAIVESVLSVIGGILVMVNEIGGGDSWLLMGPLLMILGPMIAWVSSWLLYGFGELVDAALIYRKLMSTTVSKQSESLPQKVSINIDSLCSKSIHKQFIANAHSAGFNNETEYTFWRSALGEKELVCKRCGKPIAYEHDFK